MKFSTFFRNSVFKNILNIGLLTLCIKLFGFFKESYVASTYGLSEVLDAFYIAVLIPNFVFNVFLSSIGSVFVPNYVSNSHLSKDKLEILRANGFYLNWIMSGLFLILSILVTDIYIEFFFPGKTNEFYMLVKRQFYIVSPCIFLWGTNSLITHLLHLKDSFILPVIGELIVPICIILSIYLSSQYSDLAIAIGTLTGAILNFLYLTILSKKYRFIVFRKPDINIGNSIMVLRQIPAKISSGFFTGLLPITDQYFASQLWVGSISSLNYGLKVPALIVTTAVVGINSVLLPYFSKKNIDNTANTMKDLKIIAQWVLIVGLISCLMLIMLSDYIIILLFERNSFSREDSLVVSKIQSILLVYVPFSLCGMVIVNYLTSVNRNNFMAFVAILAAIMNFTLDWYFMEKFGIYGIALCTTVVVILRFIFLVGYTYRLKLE